MKTDAIDGSQDWRHFTAAATAADFTRARSIASQGQSGTVRRRQLEQEHGVLFHEMMRLGGGRQVAG